MNRIRKTCLSLLLVPLMATATDHDDTTALEREVLAANDGWASVATEVLPFGTTGGSAADASRVHTVHDRNELIAALAHPDATPKIIRVAGMIDANVDSSGNPLGCEDYARPDPETGELYSLDAYLAAYDPEVWGRDSEPEGVQERARVASASAQQSRIRIRIPSNTTIVGVTPDATIRGAWFDIRPGSGSNNAPANVIIRNLTFVDTHDCFPQWDPTDGSAGNWNSLYDAISIRNATHVWIDHNTMLDDETADDTQPHYFGRLFQVHDGLIDITNASDYVTVSWNVLTNHDKAMLVGSSDGASADRGRLRITLHHNLFHDLGQRAPRLRFGQAHVYNNLYSVSSEGAGHYGYSWGLGIESQLYAENNHFLLPPDVPADKIIGIFNGTRAHVSGTYVNGVTPRNRIDVIAAYNEANGTSIGGEVDWTPTLFKHIDPTQSVKGKVVDNAGPLDLE